jgi:tetratricopeptide (TPR) repeat protein
VRQALALRKYNALPLVIAPLWLETEALLRGGDVTQAHEDCQRWGKLVSHIPRYRLSHLRSLAVLAGWDGDREQAIAYLEEAKALAEMMGLPGEQWPILAKLAQLYPEAEQQQVAKEQAAEIANRLAREIGDEALREAFITGCSAANSASVITLANG